MEPDLRVRKRARCNNTNMKTEFRSTEIVISTYSHHNGKNSWHKTLFVEYGSFSGALIGFLSAILAASLAWFGVQRQIDYQRYSNNIAELVYLNSELDKSHRKRYYILETRQALSPMMVASRNFSDNKFPITYPGYLHPDVKNALSMTDSFSDALMEALRGGAAGEFGFNAVALVDIVRRERQSIRDADKEILRGTASAIQSKTLYYGYAHNSIVNAASKADAMNFEFVAETVRIDKQVKVLKLRIEGLLKNTLSPRPSDL